MKRKKQDELFKFIEHGDMEHRRWLREAISCFFEGKELPIEKTPEEYRILVDDSFSERSRKLMYMVLYSLKIEPEKWTFNDESFTRKGKFNDMIFIVPDGYGYNLYDARVKSGDIIRVFEWGHGHSISKYASKIYNEIKKNKALNQIDLALEDGYNKGDIYESNNR